MRTIELARVFADHVDVHGLDDTDVDLQIGRSPGRPVAHLLSEQLPGLLQWADTLIAPYGQIRHSTAGGYITIHVHVIGSTTDQVQLEVVVVLFAHRAEWSVLAARLGPGREAVMVTVDELRELAGTAVTS